MPGNDYIKDLSQSLRDRGFYMDAKRVKRGWQWFNDTLYKPTETAYLKLPAQLTDIKKPYLLYRESNRMLVLAGLTLLVAGASRSCKWLPMQTTRAI
jgi:hypothetical protein